ncbi:hypothetical protein [Herbaspirillum sp. meg3]|uniref:hypothetical protein n=1 Tax=Herbaspirillum sp. meg3 TaxID=2025949 RepID=UPI0012FE49C8|nr:hypothetical protein [Herbaspirillum sp. meg3]
MKLATQYALILAFLCPPAIAQPKPDAEPPKNMITPLPGQNAWEIREVDPDSEEVRTFRYVLRNQIAPSMRSTIDIDKEGRQFVYRYRLSNGKQAEQDINNFWICCVPLQVFVVPEDEPFPKKTGDKDKDKAAMSEWYKRMRAGAELIVSGGDRYLPAPASWDPSLKQGDGSAGYGWLAHFTKGIPYGMPPGTWAEGFAFLRPELPGVRIAKLQGFAKNDQVPGSYDIDTDDPKLKAEIAAIARSDGRWLPVLAPVFPVPEPFDATVFTRELWSEIENTWYRDDDYSLTMLAPEVFTQLQREFKLLIPALEANNTSAAKAGIARMLAYMAQLTAPDSVTPENAGQEQAANDTTPLPTTRAPVTDPNSVDAATHTIHRVAARALVFNLAYLQEHLGSGK